MPEANYVDRPPRIQPELPTGVVEIPAPPKNDEGQRQPLWQVAVPLVTIVGYIFVSAFGQGSSNISFLIPMALAVVISAAVSVYNALKARRVLAQKRAAYTQRLIEMRKEMVASHDKQRTFYLYNYPDVDVTLMIDGQHRDNRSGSRLWERRSYDDDFGAVRLGMGARNSTVTYVVAKADNDEDPLMQEAIRLAADSKIVFDVPIIIPLYQKPIKRGEEKNEQGKDEDAPPAPIIQQSLGIAGTPDYVYPFAYSLLSHMTALHSPNDMQLYILGLHDAKPNWDWAAHLPHTKTGKSDNETSLFFERAEGKDPDKERDAVSLYWKSLWTELDRRARRLRDRDEKDDTNITLPFMLVVVDMLATKPGREDSPLEKSALKELESEAAIALLLQQGAALGAAILFLVPERSKVPSGCQSVVEITLSEDVNFLYAEVGVNTPRYVGRADLVREPLRLQEFAVALELCKVRRSFGADMPRAVTLLELYKSTSVDGLHILETWRDSLDDKKADWLEVPIGYLSGYEPRKLKFAAHADGVHGMVAGSTGSGKSELLMTLIIGLALRYDPSIINFVLIDYKGGAAFDPFDNLPHKVDKVTNLSEGAVGRMFAAIGAEMNRRQEINRRTEVKHIVQYRNKNYHRTRDDHYPHLFVIVDEFAEMIATKPEYKAQLDSITRLGRSLGVTLILAAQRPSGVTDQMRANIKFRICLRVETKEESAELLRRPDASYLPNGIPGRGYLQVGNEYMAQVQVAYTGDEYVQPDIIDDLVSQYAQRDVILLDQMNEELPRLYDIIVMRTARLAKENNIPVQRKPWPSPLPGYLSLNSPDSIEVGYLTAEDKEFIEADMEKGDALTLSPAVTAWWEGRRHAWDGLPDWETRAMRAIIGLIDHPSQAQLRGLMVDLIRGHHILFGAAGWGKSTFLRSLITSLAATHSPRELNLYIMDFGNRSLEVFENLPHTGAYILPKEVERVRRLLRKLEQIIDERKGVFSAAQADGLLSYNDAPNRPASERLPAILVIVDNFAEFKESYEAALEIFTSLVREGLSVGVYFVVTADQLSAIGKLYSLFPERLTLKLAEEGDYASVVGRGARFVEERPGRGFRTVGRSPLEMQVAVPIGVTSEDGEDTDETKKLARFVEILKIAGKDYPHPPEIKTLAEKIYLREIIDKVTTRPWPPEVLLGIDDNDLQIKRIVLQQKPHFVITGAPTTGKTTTLYSWILSLAHRYSPDELAFVLIDRQGKLGDYGGRLRLDDLPHVLQTVISEPDDFKKLVSLLRNEYSDEKSREIYVIIDNYDDMEELQSKPSDSRMKDLGNLARRFNQKGLHFIVCGSQTSLRSADDLTRPIAATRFGMGLDTESAGQSPLNGRVPRSFGELQLPPGRGLTVEAGKVALLQVAAPYRDQATAAADMDEWVKEIIERELNRAYWSPMPEPVAPIETPSNGAVPQSTPSVTNVVVTPITNGATVNGGTPTNGNGSNGAAQPILPVYSAEQVKNMRLKLVSEGIPGNMLELIDDRGIIDMAVSRGIDGSN